MKKMRTAIQEIGFFFRTHKCCRRQWFCLLLALCAIFAPAFNSSQALAAKSTSEATQIVFSAEDDAFLDRVQKQTFRYFIDCTNPANGLVMDKALNLPADKPGVDFAHSAATIAGVGFALTVYPVGVERGWMSRETALALTRTTLKFFKEKMEHKHGFFYHFVDMKTGKRAMNCEISSIDTAIFLAGALFSAQYFNDREIHELALQLYSRVNWIWMSNGNKYVSMGWTPENGFITAAWDHYSEGLLLYILALGAPKHQVSPDSWDFQRVWGRYKGHTYLINPPLFTHQFPQVWLDFRGKRDRYANYFENSRQATLANHAFCLDNQPSFKTFAENRWGLTACIGPNEYQAYGAPPNPAIVDGTVAPAAAACSIVFTPDLSLAALREYYESKLLAENFGGRLIGRFGLSDSFNLDCNFVASEAFAINQGPMLLMIENARSGFVWKNFMKIPYITEGMQKAGFKKDGGEGNPPANAVVFETAAYVPHRRPVYESRKISENFTLAATDFADPAWNTAFPMVIDEKLSQTIVKPPLRMDFWILWRMFYNSKSLFFRFDVHDQELRANSPDEKMYLDDSLEIYINSRNLPFSWSTDHNFQIILSPDASGNELRVKEFMKGELLTKSLQWKYERVKTGYRVIMEIPRKEFELVDVDHFAASIAAHDVNANATVDVKFNWFFPLPSMMMAEIRLSELF
ncbi:MAG: hypothetical protein KKB51_00315 [Candidatus Riflebacteria bacterium]|nr:hypothetical protein [Candidatus Riflebacteria bacterium]